MGQLLRVMVVLNCEPIKNPSGKPGYARLGGVPDGFEGTARLLSQAIHDLRSFSKLKVEIATLDPQGRGLSGYVGNEGLNFLQPTISPAAVVKGIEGLAKACDLLLIDAGYRDDLTDLNQLVIFAKAVIEGATRIGAEPLVVIPELLGSDSIVPLMPLRRFKDPEPVTIMRHHEGWQVAAPHEFGMAVKLFPVPRLQLVYQPTRGKGLGEAILSLPPEEHGHRHLAREVWLEEAARSDLLKWFFGQVLPFRE